MSNLNLTTQADIVKVFQAYYETGTLFQASASNIAWIGSLYAASTFLTCFITGPIFDRGHLRLLLSIGAFLIIFAFMMISLCHSLWQFILAQGLCAGIGSGILFSIVSPLLSQWFSTHLGLANGIAAAGAAIAGIIYPIAFHNLIPRVGFPWSVRILGFMALATLTPIAFLRRRTLPSSPRAFLDKTVLTDYPFLMYSLGSTLSIIGLYSILFFLSSFVIDNRLTNPTLSFYILPILNAASLFGRILPNILADVYGPLNIAPPAAFICSILIFCMIPVKSAGAVVVMAALFGFFSAIFIALPGVAMVALIKDKSRVGTRMGMVLACTGLGSLAGGPGGGSVLSDGGWNGLWVYGGCAAAVAGVCYLVARGLHARDVKMRGEATGKVMKDKMASRKGQEEEGGPR